MKTSYETCGATTESYTLCDGFNIYGKNVSQLLSRCSGNTKFPRRTKKRFMFELSNRDLMNEFEIKFADGAENYDQYL